MPLKSLQPSTSLPIPLQPIWSCGSSSSVSPSNSELQLIRRRQDDRRYFERTDVHFNLQRDNSSVLLIDSDADIDESFSNGQIWTENRVYINSNYRGSHKELIESIGHYLRQGDTQNFDTLTFETDIVSMSAKGHIDTVLSDDDKKEIMLSNLTVANTNLAAVPSTPQRNMVNRVNSQQSQCHSPSYISLSDLNKCTSLRTKAKRVTFSGRRESTDESDFGIILPEPRPLNDEGTYFRDGKQKIDYILAYDEYSPPSCSTSSSGEMSKGRSAKIEEHRRKFMENLKATGIKMEEEVVSTGTSGKKAKISDGKSSKSGAIHFIKLSAPWHLLIHYAEELCLRAPLQALHNPDANWSDDILRLLRLPNIMSQEVPNKPLDYYTCRFKKSKVCRFLGSDHHETYFTSIQRIRIVHEILETIPYGKRKKAQIGIKRLVDEGVFSAAYPLHDGPYRQEHLYVDPTHYNKRQTLYKYWAKWTKWYKYQPLDHIREYFGEKIAMYFAWLGFYTGWLLPAAFVGCLVFLYGVLTVSHDVPSNEICTNGHLYRMCPMCDKEVCEPWFLVDVCFYIKIAYLFDHPGTVFFAVFMSFWAVSFLEYWKRKSACLSHHWDSMDFEEEEERPRPDFAARAPFVERNPVTGLKEPSFPKKIRIQRMAAGFGAIAFMMVLVLIFIVAVIIYRILVSMPLFKSQTFRGWASLIASSSGALVNLVLIMALGRVYEKLAYRLTEWEMHRTQTDFDNHLTFKVFIFQFFNFYSSIFYIAFFKGRFVGYPNHYTNLFGLRNEECSNSGCLMELAQQLAIIMIGKQVINNAQEIIWPKMKTWWHRKKTNLNKNSSLLNRWEEDYQLIPYEGLFDEYLEMVLQFGFITIFVAAFPLAPLFALLNNWVEIRLDAKKLVCETRRPVAERAQNIGIWFTILNFLAHLAVISNAFLIAFTSEFLPKMLYEYEISSDFQQYVNFTLAYAKVGSRNEECRYTGFRGRDGNHIPFYWKLMFVRFAFVCVFEHIVFSVCRLIDLVVPDIPRNLELKIKRERYLAKQALADSDKILKQASKGFDKDPDEDNVSERVECDASSNKLKSDDQGQTRVK